MTEIIFKARTGSHLFGTTTPTSDIDIKGVYIPSAREILMAKIPEIIDLSTGSDKTKNTSDDVDEEYYALHKFLGMISKGDMVATEMLFAQGMEIEHWSGNDYYGRNQIWYDLHKNKHRLLSRECKGFVGYVQRQANTYSVKGDRLNDINDAIYYLKHLQIRNPDAKKLSDVPDFREITAGFCNQITSPRSHTSYEYVEVNGKEVFHFICCDRKVPDSVTFKTAIDVFQKVADEYGHRARMAADNQGRDWKAISHAIRVGEEAIELLNTGNITFPRPNASYLLDIKLGNVEYSKVSDQLDSILAQVETLVSTSPLPEKPDYQWIEDFYLSVYRDVVLVSDWNYFEGK